MAVTSDHGKAFSLPKGKAHLLIIEARFYDDLSDALLDGAKAALDAAGATYDVVTVPGALEVPAVISFALDGASLTVNKVEATRFDVLLIHHSLSVTTWGERQAGDEVNLEIDTMARYAARLAEAAREGL